MFDLAIYILGQELAGPLRQLPGRPLPGREALGRAEAPDRGGHASQSEPELLDRAVAPQPEEPGGHGLGDGLGRAGAYLAEDLPGGAPKAGGSSPSRVYSQGSRRPPWLLRS